MQTAKIFYVKLDLYLRIGAIIQDYIYSLNTIFWKFLK